MNPRQIEAFRAVMRTGTTTRAAELMHTSQSAVSRLLVQLEASLRLKLFEREGPRLRPTPEAKALMVDVERMFLGLDQLEERARNLREGRSGILSIASLPALGFGPLPAIVAALRETMPELSVRLDIMSSAEVRDRVASGQCDIGFAADEIDTQGIVARPFARRKAKLAVPTGHPLTRLASVSLAEVSAYPFIALATTDSTQRSLNAALAAEGRALKVAVQTPYSLTVAMLVRGGAGIGLVSPMSIGPFAWDGIELLDIEEDIWFSTLVIHAAATTLSAPAQQLVQLAEEKLGAV